MWKAVSGGTPGRQKEGPQPPPLQASLSLQHRLLILHLVTSLLLLHILQVPKLQTSPLYCQLRRHCTPHPRSTSHSPYDTSCNLHFVTEMGPYLLAGMAWRPSSLLQWTTHTSTRLASMILGPMKSTQRSSPSPMSFLPCSRILLLQLKNPPSTSTYSNALLAWYTVQT